MKYKVSQKIVSRLCGYCGGAVDSIISLFTQLHRSGFNLFEFETLFESVCDKWLLIYGGCFKKALLLFSSNAKINDVFKERVLASY